MLDPVPEFAGGARSCGNTSPPHLAHNEFPESDDADKQSPGDEPVFFVQTALADEWILR